MTATDQNPQQSAQPTPRKTINVVGAAIVKDGKVLCAQRGEGRSLAGFWEFPGGKIEPHETARQALHREIEEELLCEVEVATKCARLLTITISVPSCSRRLCAI